jgi:hypothetical protein
MFWPDLVRQVNFEQGFAYNNVVVSNDRLVTDFMQTEWGPIHVGQAYWATPDMRILRPATAFDGRYRWLRPEYPHNYKMAEAEFGLQADGNILTSGGVNQVNEEVYLKYSVAQR